MAADNVGRGDSDDRTDEDLRQQADDEQRQAAGCESADRNLVVAEQAADSICRPALVPRSVLSRAQDFGLDAQVRPRLAPSRSSRAPHTQGRVRSATDLDSRSEAIAEFGG